MHALNPAKAKDEQSSFIFPDPTLECPSAGKDICAGNHCQLEIHERLFPLAPIILLFAHECMSTKLECAMTNQTETNA
jgi:hypothetical protein